MLPIGASAVSLARFRAFEYFPCCGRIEHLLTLPTLISLEANFGELPRMGLEDVARFCEKGLA